MFGITNVRIKLFPGHRENGERLIAFAKITLDDAFVVGDMKLIESDRGLFVSMPSRKIADRCAQCHFKNPLMAAYCNRCGNELGLARPKPDQWGQIKLYADVAHPITKGCREMIEMAVFHAYHEELHASRLPGYRCRYDEYDDQDHDHDVITQHNGLGGRLAARRAV